MLAELGVTGPLEVLDHRGGLHQVFDPGLGLRDAVGAGRGRALHHDLGDQALRLHRHGADHGGRGAGRCIRGCATGSTASRDRVVMADLPMIRKQQGEVHRRYPETREAADHSFTFLPAVVLMDGELDASSSANERWDEPATKALTAKVRLAVSEELGARAPGAMPCRLEVHLAGGETIETECLFPPGHSFPDRGLNAAPVVEKFITITDELMGRERQARLIDGSARTFATRASVSSDSRRCWHPRQEHEQPRRSARKKSCFNQGGRR